MHVLAFSVIFIAFFSIPNFSYAVDSDCIALFKKNNLKAKDKSCLSKCTTIQVDMDSYMCPLQCEKFCKNPCKDILKKFEQTISAEFEIFKPEKSVSR